MHELKRILLVEDNANDVELTLRAFKKYNLVNEVVVTRDGVEALDFLKRKGKYNDRPKGNPEVILLDIKLPKLNGLELLKLIRSDEDLKYIPVIILSSSKQDKDLIDSYKLGVNAYVVKPVDFHEFVNAVKEIGIFWALINVPPPPNMNKR